ncbi:prenyltransferase [Indiicoccus explosivorum]|uniref:prenyltransferase n=1 Tax=Indiicoccus explosivorum TaxID=1917864 RepID=UPI001F4F058E|nr:UbiA family prenyltransferase [Indiicoccus explosivorum]
MQKAEVTKQHFTYNGSWVKLMRPMTLTGTITPVLAGTAYAAGIGTVRWDVFLVFLLASLLIQMPVNVLNDYFDFGRGQDADRWTEGGTGPAYELLPGVATAMLLVAFSLGVWLAMMSSGFIFFAGVLCVAGGVFYSAGKKSLAALGLGEVTAAALMGFAVFVLAVAVQGAPIGIVTFMAALPFALLIAAMILANNIRDIEKDKGFRRTVPILIGKQKAMLILSLLSVGAYIWVLFLASVRIIPIPALLILLAVPVAMRFDKKVWLNEAGGMKWTAMHHWTFGLLYALGLWLTL